MFTPIIAVVTRETRMAGLKARYATRGAAKFRMQVAVEHEVERRVAKKRQMGETLNEVVLDQLVMAAGALADESEYQSEDETYQRTVRKLMSEIDLGYPV